MSSVVISERILQQKARLSGLRLSTTGTPPARRSVEVDRGLRRYKRAQPALPFYPDEFSHIAQKPWPAGTE